MSFDPLRRAVLAELGLLAYQLNAPDQGGADSELLARIARAAGVSEARLLASPGIMAQAARMGSDPGARRTLWRCLRTLRKAGR